MLLEAPAFEIGNNLHPSNLEYLPNKRASATVDRSKKLIPTIKDSLAHRTLFFSKALSPSVWIDLGRIMEYHRIPKSSFSCLRISSVVRAGVGWLDFIRIFLDLTPFQNQRKRKSFTSTPLLYSHSVTLFLPHVCNSAICVFSVGLLSCITVLLCPHCCLREIVIFFHVHDSAFFPRHSGLFVVSVEIWVCSNLRWHKPTDAPGRDDPPWAEFPVQTLNLDQRLC